MHPLLVLAQAKKLAMVSLCLGTRKRTQAWNPGSFGCRGLLVYGPAKARFRPFLLLSAPRCSQWSSLPPPKIDKLSYGVDYDRHLFCAIGFALSAEVDIRRQQPCP